MHYKYCPECGDKLRDKPAGDDGMVPYCEKCNQYWFDSFADCVIVLVYNELDEIILVRQEYLSAQHSTLISGYITPGESAEETAIREVKEEVNADIERLEYAGTHWFARREQLMHAFIGYAPKCELKISKELDSAEWVPALEAPNTLAPERPGSCVYHIYRQYLKMLEERKCHECRD